MVDRSKARLRDIVDAIDQIEQMLVGSEFHAVISDRVKWAAFERFVEIISEASRHVPDELKRSEPEIPWGRVAAIGNQLRHAYHRVDTEIMWRLRSDGHLAHLRAAAERFLANN